MPDAPTNCGCKVQGNYLVKSCDLHLAQQRNTVKVTSVLLLTKIKKIFKDTHLRELEEEIQQEISRFIK